MSQEKKNECGCKDSTSERLKRVARDTALGAKAGGLLAGPAGAAIGAVVGCYFSATSNFEDKLPKSFYDDDSGLG